MEEKKPLPKDSLKKIVKIMEHVEEHDEQLTERDIETKFGDDNYHMFSRYCLGGNEAYAHDPSGKFKLTQIGVRRLHELRKVLAEERRAEWIKWATIIITIFAGLQILLFFR